MPAAGLHVREAERLASLRSYQAMYSPADPAIDAVTAGAARALGAPIALVTLLDDRRQWFRSKVGLDVTETHRDLAFCGYVVQGEQSLLVPDASLDPRFSDNPFVTGDFHLRYYAGAPLIGRDGLPLGALCVLDVVPRYEESPLPVLEGLARAVVELLELRRLDAAAGLEDRNVLDESRRLRHAIDAAELRVHYQPIVDLGTGRVRSAEALVRWEHPECGLLPPGIFLPVAEVSGLMVPLGRYVLEQACQQVQTWRSTMECARDLRVAVNMSGRQLMEPDVADTVRSALRRSGLPPGALTLELTETAIVGAHSQVDAALAQVRGMGVLLALDDFGTGYSSLAHLQRFQPDKVKLDRSFVQRLGRSPRDDAIAEATVKLARTLGSAVVAEGIEDGAQQAAAGALGCDYGQGFYFARPQPPEGFAALLEAGAAAA